MSYKVYGLFKETNDGARNRLIFTRGGMGELEAVCDLFYSFLLLLLLLLIFFPPPLGLGGFVAGWRNAASSQALVTLSRRDGRFFFKQSSIAFINDLCRIKQPEEHDYRALI